MLKVTHIEMCGWIFNWQDLHENEPESHFVSVPQFQSLDLWFKFKFAYSSSNSNSVQIPFRNTTDVHTFDWRTYREHLFLREETHEAHTWNTSIYLFYISRTTETRHISAPLLSTYFYQYTYIDAPLSTYANLGAICTSIDPLESSRHLHLCWSTWTVSKNLQDAKNPRRQETPSKRRN